VKRKKISAYRVYKKEIASQIKEEFPKMNNSERQMIVKERWKCLSDKEKGIFVMHARYLEEKKLHSAIQEFYSQRIEAAKACSSVPFKTPDRMNIQEARDPLEQIFATPHVKVPQIHLPPKNLPSSQGLEKEESTKSTEASSAKAQIATASPSGSDQDYENAKDDHHLNMNQEICDSIFSKDFFI
jgi:hypothetical protein